MSLIYCVNSVHVTFELVTKGTCPQRPREKPRRVLYAHHRFLHGIKSPSRCHVQRGKLQHYHVARTLARTEREREPTVSLERRLCFHSSEEIHARDQETAIEGHETTNQMPLDGNATVGTGSIDAVSPRREDILGRFPSSCVPPPQTPHSAVGISPSSPRRFMGATDIALSSSRPQVCAAGMTTEEADRYRMKRSSGKRLRSPQTHTTSWQDFGHSDRHDSRASSTMSTPSFSHKRQVRSAAERTFGGSAVARTLNMETSRKPQVESMRSEHCPVVPESDALANEGARNCLALDDESKQMKETKRVSFRSKHRPHTPDNLVTHPQPRTLPVLADKTTQTDDFLLPTCTCHCHVEETDRPGLPSRSSACDQRRGECERRSTQGAPTAAQANDRRSSSHLTNPLLVNPRYPPAPTSFQGKSMYSTVFNDRLPWR
ncbi:hypothetical protein PsorP6_013535 [Peronosclerospora sorghi]|uniref:Uncharacterized protein n=1 Tax=Peronosclerospora sorghi TaxID=230839 RepID=A0ACC0VH88_9STRA|nr:hypothetical protein PsorP6_013535 [Peronosclerospora sorghi]